MVVFLSNILELQPKLLGFKVIRPVRTLDALVLLLQVRDEQVLVVLDAPQLVVLGLEHVDLLLQLH